jgi:hypothetical protein
MLEYHGIIVDESLRNKMLLQKFTALASRPSSTNPWNLYLVEVRGGELEHKILLLQKNMKHRYYAHFYHGNELRVVFSDRIFIADVNDKGSWHAFQDYGLKLGIPKEQLECKPVRVEDEKDWLER